MSLRVISTRNRIIKMLRYYAQGYWSRANEKQMLHRISLISVLAMLTLWAGTWFAATRANDGEKPQTRVLRGAVLDAKGPIDAARVRLQGTMCTALTDEKGRFRLSVSQEKRRRVTAWKKGYVIGSSEFKNSPVKVLLTPLPQMDNDDYQWIDPAPNPNQPKNCGNCHPQIYKEWHASAHGRSGKNRRFLNLFAGTDWNGNASPRWNLLKEHPLGSGVCATCHAPTFRDPTLAYDMRKIPGVAARGVHCDYCHKIVKAATGNLGITFGKDGYELLRPKGEQQLFFGPLDDAYRKGEMFGYLPLYKDSKYCASCHEGVVFGVHVYGTYSEWLKSPAKTKGLHCQHCHMKPTGKMTNIAPGKGGIERDPKTLASHHFPGATEEMLRRCLRLQVRLESDKQTTVVDVEVIAQNVGHRVPTGFIDRHLLLVVEAQDQTKKSVALQKGSTLPLPAGKKLAGKPGKLYAKLLHDNKGKAPIPFWLPHGKMTDNRLHPEQPDRQKFIFAAGVAKVRVRLIYRRFWDEVTRSKHWPRDEIVVAEWCRPP